MIGVFLGSAATCIGAVVGTWLGHRVRNNISPLPRLSGLIEVFRRKPKAVVNQKNWPAMKRMKV